MKAKKIFLLLALLVTSARFMSEKPVDFIREDGRNQTSEYKEVCISTKCAEGGVPILKKDPRWTPPIKLPKEKTS